MSKDIYGLRGVKKAIVGNSHKPTGGAKDLWITIKQDKDMEKRIIIIALLSLIMTACARKTFTHMETVHDTLTVTRTDTVTYHRTDTVRIIQRIVDVAVDVPTSNLYRETKDTVSVLDNGLYKSVARIVNGTLSHSLQSVEGAKIQGKAAVADTVTISKELTAEKSADNTLRSKSADKYVYREKQLSPWQQFVLRVGTFAVSVSLLAIVCALVSLFRWIGKRRGII